MQSNSQPKPSRAERVTRGAGWLYAYRWLDRGLTVVSIAVLARILTPEDFGLVAVAASFVAIIEGLSDFDVTKALIQSRSPDRDLCDSAWTLAALRGLATALVMLAVTPFLDDPRLPPILWVIAAAPLVGGLANPRFVMFERELVYSRVAVQTLAAKVASFLVTLGIALLYRSYWALVVGIVAQSLVTTILSYALRPYRPRISLSRGWEIVSFSGWMTLATVVSTLSMRTDRIIVERFLGFTGAGLYHMTERISVLPTSELVGPLQRVLFPAFSELTNEPRRLREVAAESIGVVSTLSFPAAVGFALLANDFVPLVLGDQWIEIAPLLAVLVPFLGIRSTLLTARSCVMATAKTQLMFKASLAYAVVHLPAFIAGTALYGLEGAVWSIVLAGLFYAYLNIWLLNRSVGVSFGAVLSQMRRPALAVAAMVAATFALNAILPIDLFATQGSWASLITKLLLGVLVFTGTQSLLWLRAGRPPGLEERVIRLLRERGFRA